MTTDRQDRQEREVEIAALRRVMVAAPELVGVDVPSALWGAARVLNEIRDLAASL